MFFASELGYETIEIKHLQKQLSDQVLCRNLIQVNARRMSSHFSLSSPRFSRYQIYKLFNSNRKRLNLHRTRPKEISRIKYTLITACPQKSFYLCQEKSRLKVETQLSTGSNKHIFNQDQLRPLSYSISDSLTY